MIFHSCLSDPSLFPSISSIPVQFSIYYDRNAPPVLYRGVVYAHDAEHVRKWLDDGWLREMGIAPLG